MTRSRHNLYQRADGGILRAALHTSGPALPPWPDRNSPTDLWREWLDAVWGTDDFARAVTAASPDLAHQVQAVVSGELADVRRARRAALSVAKYAIRFTGRAVPFGLFAGVAGVAFGGDVAVRVGNRHLLTARAEPVALAAMIDALEADPQVMADVEVCVNNLSYKVIEDDGRGIVCIPADGANEYLVTRTPVVDLVMVAAHEPITCAELASTVLAEFPDAGADRCAAVLTSLLRAGLLRSALRAPATVPDPADGLKCVGPAGAVVRQESKPVALDVLLDADVRLPEPVGLEMETAATQLARMAVFPAGTPAWRAYAERFAERYGSGVLIGIPELTHPRTGLGFPAGFGAVYAPPRPMSKRDRVLLELAQDAALTGSQTVTLTGAMIAEIAKASDRSPERPAPHLEICGQILAVSMQALEAGNFRLRVHTVSRAGGSMGGRFWHLFSGDPAPGYTELPTVEPGAARAQLSFHPTRVRADLLTRVPQVLPTIVSVGEHRRRAPGVLFPEDLAVGMAENGSLFLAVAATGEHLEIFAPTAVNFVWNNYTPSLARLLAEIARAACPQITAFDWGAAQVLPFTPALHYRRSILIPARWRIRASDLPGRTAPTDEWADALHRWRERHRTPDRVLLSYDDQHLPLDLHDPLHLDVLRTHLTAGGTAALMDAPPVDSDGWIGNRAHSIVVTMAARP